MKDCRAKRSVLRAAAIAVRAAGAAALLLLACSALAQDEKAPETEKHGPDFNGHVSLESGYGTAEGRLQKLRLEVLTQISAALSEYTDYTVIARSRVDPMFDNGHIEGTDFPEVSPATRMLRLGETAELELREAYVRTRWQDWHFTLGKQQIVWGVADGLKVLDVVNPEDLREFILTDFESSRIPLWAVNAERPIKDWNLQLIWIPDESYYIFPRQGSEFEFKYGVPKIPPGFHLDIEPAERPGRFFADSDVGFRLSTFKGGWDITFNYLYYYDDLPAFPRTFGLSSDGLTVAAHPEYKRAQLIGGSLSKAFKNVTLRTEYGLFLNRHFSTGSVFDRDGVVKGNNPSYMVGLDWFGLKDTVVSVQLFQDWFTNDARGLARDHVQTYTTLGVQRRMVHDTLTLETQWLQDVDRGDGLLRPKVTYAVNDNLTVYAGVDFFYGSDRGFFGQFDAKDRVVGGVTWSF